MRRHFSKVTAVFLALAMGVLTATGCMSRLPSDESVMAVFQGEKISKEEVGLYIYALQYDTEKDSEYIISVLYGGYENFWNESNQGVTFADSCKQDAVTTLFQTRILNLKAKADGITLTAEEEAKVEETIASFREDYAKVIEKSGASDALVEKYVRDNALANKVYLAITADVDQTFDEDEFRRKTYEGVMIYGKYYADDAEDRYDYTDEELAEAREQAIKDIEAALKEGKTISEVAENYIDDKIISVTSIASESVDPSYATDGAFTSYRQLAWSLKTGETGSVVTKNSADKEVGFVLRSLNDDDPDERKAAEAEALSERREELFQKAYGKLSQKYGDFVVREEALKNYVIEGGIYESEILSEEASE